MQTGLLPGGEESTGDTVVELIVAPILSRQSFQPLGALVVGFPLPLRVLLPNNTPIELALWSQGRLLGSTMAAEQAATLERKIKSEEIPASQGEEVSISEVDYALQWRTLNEGSEYPVVKAVFATPLTSLLLQQERLRNHIFLAAIFFLLFGLVAAHLIAVRFSKPVRVLADASEKEHVQRIRAETALDTTHRELERAVRFSADASHQLKTPVTVVRAGLEELLREEELRPEAREEIDCLIQQTGRLTRVIDDLLLLSRLDSGSLTIQKETVDLRLLVEELLDDLSIQEAQGELEIQMEVPRPCMVAGDRIYTSLLLQCLLENARKYNRPSGILRMSAHRSGSMVKFFIGNSGQSIPEDLRDRIFERFHRGRSGENVNGYGLGLNLAMELTRLHDGKLELYRSEDDWTEFALHLRADEHNFAT
jgi:signal transduction histidine kinase